jgi:uncharacterized protein (TIGR02217 family)
MTFHDIELPTKFFGFGSAFGPQHDTLIMPASNGFEHRVENWRHPRRHYDVTNAIVEDVDLRELTEFVIAREGSLHSFKVTDPMDFTTAAIPVNDPGAEDVRIGTGDGITQKFWIVKRYCDVSGRYELTRRLQKTNLVIAALDGSPLTQGIDFSVNHEEGSLTFDISPPSRGSAITIGATFFVEVRFKLDLDDWLKNSLDDFDAGSVSAPMIEEKVSTTQDHDRQPIDIGFSHPSTLGRVQLEFQHGLFHFITPAAAMVARLPDIRGKSGEVGFESADITHEGGPYFVIFNLGTFDITVDELFSANTWSALSPNSVIPPKRGKKVFINSTGHYRMF